MSGILRLLGLQRPCEGWIRRWGFTIKCKEPYLHRGPHRNGRLRWKPGE